MNDQRDDLELVIEPGRLILSRPSGRLAQADLDRAQLLKAYIDRGRQNGGSDAEE